MCIELEYLEGMVAWDVVDCEDDMNVIISTWAFKLKRYYDGLIKTFKARFCTPGTCNSKELIILKLMRLLFNGPPFV